MTACAAVFNALLVFWFIKLAITESIRLLPVEVSLQYRRMRRGPARLATGVENGGSWLNTWFINDRNGSQHPL